MRSLSLCLVWCLSIVLAAADRPHPAKIYIDGRSEPFDAYIISDQVDELRYSQDEEGEQKGVFKQAQVVEVAYESVADRHWYTAMGKLNAGDPAAAAKLFAETIDKGRSEYDRIEGHLGRIRALAAAKQPKEAAKAVDAFVAAFPKSRFLLQALETKGEVLLAAGDLAAAETAFAALNEIDLGSMTPRAKALATAGSARILLAKGEHAAAAAAVESGLKGMQRDAQPDAYAALGIVGVRAKLAAKDDAGAKTLAGQLLYLGSNLGNQAEAHLAVANALAGSEPVKAFDHAVIASLRGRDVAPAIASAATALARKLGRQLATDDSLPDAERLAYQEYSRKL